MGLGLARMASAQSWTDLRSRLISSLVLGCLVLAVAVIGGPIFRAFCCATGVIVFEEWARMTRAKRAGPIFKFARRSLFFALFAFLLGEDVLAIGIVAAAGMFVAFIDRGERKADWVLGGLAYAAVAALAPGMLRGDDAAGLAVLGLVICVVWPTDIFAYFTGRTIGGPKIMPAVSPKKTISGSLGGLVAGIFCGTALYVEVAGQFHVWILLFTALLSILGQAGDLFESWIKRRFGVKDSGRIIPGHGGLMDRIDALIVAMAAAWLFGLAVQGFDNPALAIFDI
ncbi:MAG: phosphatidate cytidylyltransferase [Rhizobiaceae bacterium]|nr:phosphatidate cytidylyltransferase [Rhizobiaceae bacterium]